MTANEGGQPPVILISAMSSDRVIGSGDGMPWSVPEEYERYLATVRDGTVVMGRRSFEIFGEDLAPERCVVVTRGGPRDGVRTAGSVREAIGVAAADGRPVFVAGGASVYEQAMPLADHMHLSVIHGEFAGDTHFPEFDPGDWRAVRNEAHERYDFTHYARP